MIQAIALLAGFMAIVGQIVLMREIMVLFNGDELSLGLALAAWLAWTATGSAAAGRWLQTRSQARAATAIVICLCGAALPLTVFALRVGRALMQTVPGELLGPGRTTIECLVCLSAFCSVCGALFPLVAHSLRATRENPASLAGSSAYLLETAGSACGGGLASLILVRFLGTMQIASVTGLVCVAAGASMLCRTRRACAFTLLSITMLAVPLIKYVSPRLDAWTQERLWPGFDLLASRDSIFGHLTVMQADGLRSIYDNGAILASVPDPAAAEESAHFALLEHPSPARVLFIGGGLNGSIAEALKHPSLESLDYVELDPGLLDLYREHFPGEYAQAFSDARVHAHALDGRVYVQQSTRSFDVIVVNVPEPSTAQLNRFYTEDFFRIVREHLAPGGLVALELRSSAEYIRPELAALLRCLQRTLREVFPRVIVIPGDTVRLFASVDPVALTDDPAVLIARRKSRGLHTTFVRDWSVLYRMTPDRMDDLHAALAADMHAPVNRDFRPVAYYLSAVLWRAHFGNASSGALERVERIPLSRTVPAMILILILIALTALFAFGGTPERRARHAAASCVAASGFTLMALELLLLLSFQAVFGYMYGEMAMLIGMFMAGMAAGTWLGMKFTGTSRPSLTRAAALVQLVLAISAPVSLLAASLCAHGVRAGVVILAAHVAFPVLALMCGIPGGLQFPVASAIYFRNQAAGTNLSALYALDLLGGCMGALLLSGLLIPVFGLWTVAWLTASVSLPSLALMVRADFQRAANSALQMAGR